MRELVNSASLNLFQYERCSCAALCTVLQIKQSICVIPHLKHQDSWLFLVGIALLFALLLES